MRAGAYFLFEIVAWPAAIWCGMELVLRVAMGETAGIDSAGLTGACAALTIVSVRWRSRKPELASASQSGD